VSWLKIDDRIQDHPKFVRVERLSGTTGFYLWVGLMSYCKQRRTDGWVPIDMLGEVNGPRGRWRQRALDALLEVGLVERDGDRLHVHDYLDWNASRYEIEHAKKGTEPPAESEVSAESEQSQINLRATSDQSQRTVSVKSASRDSKKNGHVGVARLRARSESESESESESIQIPLVPPSDPSPAAPTSTKKKSSTQLGKRICPLDFAPNASALQLATELGFTDQRERETRAEFVDYWNDEGVLKSGWQGTYRNRLRFIAKRDGIKPVKHDPQREEYQAKLRAATQAPSTVVPVPLEYASKVRNLFS
jgi:hypothetical protein